MNLISCNACGVVLDADKVGFPDHIHDKNGCIDHNFAKWNGEEFVAYTECPVCKYKLLKEK